MIKISKRLEVIASLVPINSVVADIGCDHGLLSIYLFQSKKVKKIIAADINENALENARKNIKKYSLEEGIETRLGDGISVIKDIDNVDTLVIAGMGERTITKMFYDEIDKLNNIKTIIIQSNTRVEYLRREIVKLGYIISDEEIVLDSKKYYIVIKFEKGKKKYTKKEYFFGPVLLKKNSNLFKEYQKQELEKLMIIKKLLPWNKFYENYQINKKIRLYKSL